MLRPLSLALLALLSTGALAHAHIEKAVPAADSKSAVVKEIRLNFSEAIEAKLSSIRLEDREDRAVVEPSAAADPSDSKVLVLPLFEKLPPGSYRARWAVVSADGHRVSGSYSFIVSP